jgi:acyl-CoA thioesterase-1
MTALLQRLVRFQQPEKALTYLGPLEDSRIAALFGLPCAVPRTGSS